MRSIAESNNLAKTICAGKYKYLYGAKDQDYTSTLVDKLAKAYPSTYTPSLKKLALEDADKGFKGIDCSGFVCKVLGVPNMGSSTLYSTAVKTYPVDKKNAKPGMALYRSGHIAYVGEDLKIYEAASTATDMKVSKWENRASAFTALIVVKGSALASINNSEPVKTTTVAKATTTTVFPKDCKVKVNGYIYANANGTGNKVQKTNAVMYIVDSTANSKYPYGVSTKLRGTRQGWVDAASMKKC